MSTNFIQIHINNVQLYVKPNTTVLQACEKINTYVPRFCYHDKLSIAGNCRMCLVEIEKSPKPVVSCAFPVMEGMKIFTDSPLVKKARENVLEFLLLNHPLDCPICDQGGECDLQDQTLIYGSDRSRFYEYKRGVEDKNCGPLIKTIMTRCIHCTRCVRFMTELTGFKNLGTTNRGNKTEIGTYVNKIFKTELSGNVIDLCPVGALTSKPYAFNARPWELKSTEAIDIMDSLNSNIRVDSRGLDILRILPRLNENLNEEWISDKARFFFDSLKYQRILSPKIKKDSNFINIDWKKILFIIANKFKTNKPEEIGIFIGNLVDLETSIALKHFSTNLGIKNIYLSKQDTQQNNLETDYVFNNDLKSFYQNDLCLIVGANPRFETSILNIKLLNNVKKNNMKIGVIGSKLDLTYTHTHLGTSIDTLIQISEGRHFFCKELKKAKNPIILLGSATFSRKDKLNNILSFLKNKYNINFYVLNSESGILNNLHINNYNILSFNSINKNLNNFKNLKLIYLIGVDVIPFKLTKDQYVIYQNTHGNELAKKADIILPSTSCFEKNSTFLNLEGRLQNNPLIIKNYKETKDDYKILKILLHLILNKTINFNIKKQINKINHINNLKLNLLQKNKISISKILNKTPLKLQFSNFYQTNYLSRLSLIMAKCHKSLKKKNNFKND